MLPRCVQEALQNTNGAAEKLLQDGALYADPDIIDLTMIPPPMTPDEVSDRRPRRTHSTDSVVM